MPEQTYDLLVIGGGMAGLTAGIYAARYGLNTAIIEQMMAGAQIINLDRIENYPGFPQGIAGYELGPAAQEQALNAGASLLMDTVRQVAADGDYLIVHGESGDTYRGKAVIMAAGSSLRALGIPGETELDGRGVSHCATCDGPLYMGQTVGVVGGGDSAADEALTLTEYADRVLLFHRGPGPGRPADPAGPHRRQPQNRGALRRRSGGHPGRGHRLRRARPHRRRRSRGSPDRAVHLCGA